MKKILVVGGSHSELPIVQEAKKKGLYVITTGNQSFGYAHRFSDEYHLVDYSDEKEILKLAEKLKIDYICFGAHDLSLFSTVYAGEKLGINFLDSYETTAILHHKDKFKKFARKHKIKTPEGFSFSKEDEAIEFALEFKTPFIVKPVDMGGGKGVTKIENKEFFQIKKAVNYAFNYSKIKKIVVEKFVEGSLHSFSAFIKDKKIKFYYGDNEFSYKDNLFGVCTSTSPSKHLDILKNKIIDELERIAKILSLKDGLIHLQYIFDGQDFHIVEITRRIPGDLYNIPVEYSTGFEYTKTILEFSCGISPKISTLEQKKFVSRHCITSKEKLFHGVYEDVSIKENIKERYIFVDKNSKIYHPKVGIFILEYSSYEEMEYKTKNINNLIRPKTIKGDLIYT